MIREIRSEPLPIKMWLEDVEPGALEQARNLARLPFAFRHIALMPDCHQGFGMPIGGVLATKEAIIPNAVGVDIGCGMCAVQTSLDEVNALDLKKILAAIRDRIPLGFRHHDKPQDESLMPRIESDTALPVAAREYQSALRQLGTLGGGNHFIELQKGSDGRIWVMIHSGSRNIGKQVADHYNRLAGVWTGSQGQEHLVKQQLAWLPLHGAEGEQYIREMNYCIDFAFANRKLMMQRTLEVLSDFARGGFGHAPMINIAHNYAAIETHYGESVMVHRKGATKASTETIGIIPGSQGAPSFIVRGKGKPESFQSCSHGAGRVMGRKQAIRSLNLKQEKEKLDARGILHSIRSQSDLEEAASAYKDIHQVMDYQKDLVDVLTRLEPLAVIKG